MTQKTLNMSIIRKFIVLDPIFDEIDEIMKRYINTYYKKYEQAEVRCVLKHSSTTKRVRHIRINTKPNLDYHFKFSKNSILSRINQDRYFFLIYLKCVSLSVVLLEIWHMITFSNNNADVWS